MGNAGVESSDYWTGNVFVFPGGAMTAARLREITTVATAAEAVGGSTVRFSSNTVSIGLATVWLSPTAIHCHPSMVRVFADAIAEAWRRERIGDDADGLWDSEEEEDEAADDSPGDRGDQVRPEATEDNEDYGIEPALCVIDAPPPGPTVVATIPLLRTNAHGVTLE